MNSPKIFDRYFLKLLLIIFLLFNEGCATRYVDRDIEKTAPSDLIGDVVVFKSSEEFKANPPVCLGVLPLVATKKEYEPTDILRKALHAYLAPSGIKLVPLQRIDQQINPSLSEFNNLKNVSNASGCDTLITGEVIERQSTFLGVYSEVKIGASIRITRVSTGSVIWRGKHTTVVRNGGIPFNPISIIGGTISASMNLRDEQITRTTNDLARRLITAIPNLKYTDVDNDLLPKTLSASVVDSPLSVHAYIASIENQPLVDLLQELSRSLSDPRWDDPKDRLVLSEFLLKKDPNSQIGMFSNSTARLELNQPNESLSMTNRLLLIDNKSPETHFLKGRALLQLDQPAEAADSILKAAGAETPKATYFTALGLAYNQMGNHELALASLTRSLKIDPDRSYVLLQQGIAYIGIGDESEASNVLKKSMVLSIINKDHRNASRALSVFKSMNLAEQISPEDLVALETKIDNILKTP